MLEITRTVPKEAPTSREDTAGKFRAVLRVPAEVELGGGTTACLETVGNKGEDELREVQPHVGAVFDIMVTRIVLQLGDGLVSTTELESKQLRAVEQVAVRKGECCRHAKVASGIGTVQFQTDGHSLGRRHRDKARECAVGCLGEIDVRILYCTKAGE